MSIRNQQYLPENLSLKDTIKFMPPIVEGKVLSVYDGDTITLGSRIIGWAESPIYKWKVRLSAIDTPEIRTNNPKEKEAA